MSRRRGRTGATWLFALALVVLGIAGAVGYGQDYNLRRGFSTLVQFKRAGTGRLEDVHFYSRALRREADYLVYLPPHWTAAKEYPTYYLLHGSPGKPRVFVDIANMDIRLDNQLSLGRVRPMILVYPDGRIDDDTYSDSEWANTPSGDYASYVINVVNNVDARFSAIPRRQDRVIAGFSAGAFGAMNIALHNLGTFADVQSWSGYFTETPTAVFAHASAALLAQNSPIDEIRRLHPELRRDPLRASLFVGRDDPSYAQQLPMVRQLIAAGVSQQHAVYPGGHDWGVWYPRLNQMLDMASTDVEHPPAWTPPSGVPPPSAQPGPKVSASALHPEPADPDHHHSELTLIGSLLLALISAALINFGFVLQHRGHEHARDAREAGPLGALGDPAWLIGQATGWLGFAGQIVAVALAPLTLVQAFSAGSLAISVPLAAAAFGHRVDRRQVLAIVLIGLSLATLPIGFGGAHGHLHPGWLIAAALLVLLAGAMAAEARRVSTCAVLAGVFYGVADAAIKAEANGLRFAHSGIFTGWTLLAALGTFAGFVAFQAALANGDAVRPLSLMNAFTAVAAIGLGLIAFGERLGVSTVAIVLHIVAICVVLLCARTLSGAAPAVAAGGVAAPPGPAPDVAPTASMGVWTRVRGRSGALVASLGVSAVVLIGSLTTIGLLYELRQGNLFSVGPRVADALPLLQLAGFDAQPLPRLVVAAVLAGLLSGLATRRMARSRRAALIGVGALGLLLLSSDASFALARNLRFGQVLLDRDPGLGPWLEAIVLAAGAAVPGPRWAPHAPRWVRRVPLRRAATSLTVVLAAIVVALAVITPSGHASTQPAHRRAFTAQTSAPASPSLPAMPSSLAPRALVSRAPFPAPPTTTERRADLARRLDAAFVAKVRRLRAPGATAAVAECGRVIWAGATGRANLRSGQRMTDGSLFVLNSAVKTIVATMILEEIHAGRLSLATRVARFYPELPGARRITVAMLLTMTSGLPEYLVNPRIAGTIRDEPEHRWSTGEILTGLGRGLGRLLFRPGTGFRYSDTNYIVLGGILDQLTHRPLQSTFEQLIARPLGIRGATWTRTAAAEVALARPYSRARDGALRSDWIPGFGPASVVWGPVFTDGGLAATSIDLARFANALVGGRLLSPTSLVEMTRLGPRSHYGMGIRGKSYDGQFWLGHAGAYAGYESEDWTDPARDLTIAVSTNLEVPGSLISNDIWGALVRADSATPPATACRPAQAGI